MMNLTNWLMNMMTAQIVKAAKCSVLIVRAAYLMISRRCEMKILRILGKRGRVTIPFEIRETVGFSYNDVLSFTVEDEAAGAASH